jgi:hypothetical protein
MRRKISTLIDPGLYRRVRLESVRRNKQISEIVGEALERYLQQSGREASGTGVVQETWGAIRLPAARVMEILAHEGALLDT